jgi:hypothetical protein
VVNVILAKGAGCPGLALGLQVVKDAGPAVTDTGVVVKM